MTKFRFDRSQQLYEEAQRYLAGGVSSHFRTVGKPHPMFFADGQGARMRDVDGNEYIDYTLSQGPLLLGHSPPEILDRIQQELAKGQLYAGQSEIEIELARKLTEVLPGADLVRFSNSGSDAIHTAMRLARGITGKRKIVKFEGHYHGWLDNIFIDVKPTVGDDGESTWEPSLLSGGQSPSVLEEVVILPWNDLSVVQKTLEDDPDIAAVVTEPIMCNNSCILPSAGYLEGLQDLCQRFGALLILDEVITGFRVALGGAKEYLGVSSDLTVYAKAVAGGFPISVLAGKREHLNHIASGQVIHAGTLNSNIASTAAALATLDVLIRDREALYPRITGLGQTLIEGIRNSGQAHGQPLLIQGPGPMFHSGFTTAGTVRNFRDCSNYDQNKVGEFTYRLLQRGIRVIGRGLWFVSAALTEEDVQLTLQEVDEVLGEMGDS